MLPSPTDWGLKKKEAKSKINDDVWTKPKWMRQKTFKLLQDNYFDLEEKEQITEFFSLRNHQAVEKIFAKYGFVLFAAAAWEMGLV